MHDSLKNRSYPGSTVALVGACLAGLGLLVGMAVDRIMTGRVQPLTLPASSSATNSSATNSSGENAEDRSRPAGPGLGISRERLQQALDSPVEPRFRYEESASADGGERCTGRLSGDRVYVELEGPAEGVARACLTLQLVPQRVARPNATDEAPPPTFEVPESLYMLLLANALAPGWNDSGRWVEDALADAAAGSPATVTRHGVRFTLSRLDKFGVLMFSAEPE